MTATSAPRRVGHGRLLIGLGVVGAAVVALHLLGRGSLATPPLWSGDDLERWWSSRDPITVVVAGFRLAALVVGYHLLLTSAVAAVGALVRRPDLVRLADRWTLPPLRGAVARVVGLGLSAAAALTPPVTGASASPAPATAEGTATMRSVGDEVRVLRPTPTGEVTLRLVDPPTSTGEATLSEVPVDEPDSLAPAPTPTPTSEPARADERDPTRHVVRPGDHLWSIAEASLADALGRPPTDAEVAPYWRRVVEANPQLANPDLIFPGDEVVLPAP